MLSDTLPVNLRDKNEAATLVIRNGAEYLLKDEKGADELYDEQKGVKYDTKFYAPRKKKMNNKKARYNIVFGKDTQEQYLSNYDGRQKTNTIVVNLDSDTLFSIVSFDDLPYLSQIRKKLKKVLGPKANNLNAEGNYYFEEQSGIGYHGDAERKIVIGLSLGKTTILRYNWRLPGSSAHPFTNIDVTVNHGDIYIMSEKATGNDWKKRSLVRVVHAAGHRSYIDKGFQSLEDEVLKKSKK